MLAGAIQPGEGAAGTGLTLIAAQGKVAMQAQSDTLAIQAKDEVNVQSANASVDFASAKRIVLRVAGGAAIEIAGGNITVKAPGNVTVHASQRSFAGPARMSYQLPTMPKSESAPEKLNYKLTLQDAPGNNGTAMPNREWQAVVLKSAATGSGGHAGNPDNWRNTLASGTSGGDGACALNDEQKKAVWEAVNRYPERVWLVSGTKAIPLSMSSLATDDGDREQRKTLDALNVARSGDDLDDVEKRMRIASVEHDYDARLTARPKGDASS
jgi:type VI secretion system secreted protein VgrG